MPDKNLTDVEIKSALKGAILNAKGYDSKVWSIEVYKLELALDLINRLQEKNSNLQEKNSNLQEKNLNLTSDLTSLQNDLTSARATIDSFTDIGKLYSEIKAEAYKEFAERLKGTFPKDDFLRSTKRISEDIDNLLKEMGDSE